KLGELFDFLAVKTKMSFLAHVDEVLVGAAGQAYDEGAAWLQAALADGKVQPDEWRDLLERTKRIGKSLIDIETLKGYVGADNVDSYLATRAGHAIASSKARGAGAKTMTPEMAPVDPS